MGTPEQNPSDKRNPNPLSPNTTAEQDLTNAGQRRVNIIWEITQAIIALSVVMASMGAATWLTVQGSAQQIPTMLSMAFGTVVGFYFSRTNHAAIGGVGPKPTDTQDYIGR